MQSDRHSNLLNELLEFKVTCFPIAERSRRASLLVPREFDSTNLETHQIPLQQPNKFQHRHPSESAQINVKYRKILRDQRIANKKKLMEKGSLLATQQNIRQTLRLMAQSAEPSGRMNSQFLERKIIKETRLFALQIGESKSYVVNIRDRKEQSRSEEACQVPLDVLTVTKLHGIDARQKTRGKFFSGSTEKPLIKFRAPRLVPRLDSSSPESRSLVSKKAVTQDKSLIKVAQSSQISTASLETEETQLTIQFGNGPFQAEILQPEALFSKGGISGEAFTVLHFEAGRYRIIAQHRQQERLEFASLTKIMTCLLVLLISEKMKLDLKKTSTKVSHRAASLQGTTAKLEAGDSLSVYDLLHGMMLPSGNDAAMALAEWGGKTIRCYFRRRDDNASPRKSKTAKLGEANKRTVVGLFIYHMNCIAKKLGMSYTRFSNCHGLMNRRNYSCSQDLTRLCVFAMQRIDFTAVVCKTSYTCTANNVKYLTQRALSWTNTNKLLKLNGITGIKTGITPSAGSCLASCFAVSPSERIYVVLLKSLTVQHRFEESKQLLVEALRWLYQTTGGRQYIEQLQLITNQNLEQLPGEANEDSNNFEPPEQEDEDAFEDESQICDINIDI